MLDPMTLGVGFRLALTFALASAGCTIIFDTDGLPTIDAPVDAPLPIDAPVDSDPTMLTLTSVTPAVVDEGVGTGGGRPVVFSIEAMHLLSEATIDLAWLPDDPGTPVSLVEPAAISGATGRIAFAIVIPEIAALTEGNSRMLIIGVNAGSERRTIPVFVRGHDPLALTGGAIVSTEARFETQTYSSITISGATTVTGARRLRLAAFGPIRLDGSITSLGPNLGGCSGGGPQMGASCGAAGGGPGAQGPAVGTGGGGGGGGFGTDGATASGSGGMTRGNPLLVPIADPVNRGGGGGGGGNPGLGLGGPMGGVGGGGGGAIEIRAGGAITVTALGDVTVDGGPGTVSSSAGGGGGAGGAILIDSGAPIVQPAVEWLSARGAAAVGNGGAGGEGRIRVDDPGRGTANATPTAVGAPDFDRATTPLVVRTPTVTLTARGPTGCFAVIPTPVSAQDLCGTSSDRQLTPTGVPITFGLAPGVNTLCLGWTIGAMLGSPLPESLNCVDVVYVAP